MLTNNFLRDLTDSLVACDEQPSDEQLTRLRAALEHKVLQMKRNGRRSLYVFFGGTIGMALGFAVAAFAAAGHQIMGWLAVTGFSVVIASAIVIVIGAIGLLLFRGFGYVWARHDVQDATLMELSAQVQRLTQRIDELDKRT